MSNYHVTLSQKHESTVSPVISCNQDNAGYYASANVQHFINLILIQPSCSPSHRTTAYQTNDALVDPGSKEKQFIILRYHVTCNNRCAHKSQEYKITRGKARGGAILPSTPCSSPLLPVSPVTPAWLISLNNASTRWCVTQCNRTRNWYQEYNNQSYNRRRKS